MRKRRIISVRSILMHAYRKKCKKSYKTPSQAMSTLAEHISGLYKIKLLYVCMYVRTYVYIH